MRNGLLRSSKVIDFGANGKRFCDFLSVINSIVTLVLSCPVSDILQIS